MTTAALIVAAGMSSRMGDFKPMLNIGSISIAQRVVATFQQAGVDKIVMVTGYNAIALERHLTGNGIIFLRNEEFQTTPMFTSVCIGLNYLKDKCDRVLFTPVDIPLFTAATVQTLLESDARLASPVCEGEIGHPTLIASGLIDSTWRMTAARGCAARWSAVGNPWRRSRWRTRACSTTRTRRRITGPCWPTTTSSWFVR